MLDASQVAPQQGGGVRAIQRSPVLGAPPLASELVVQRQGAFGVGVEGSEDVSLIHRADPEGGDTDAVRCYLTVFARAEEGDTGRHKDIHAAPGGSVLFVNKSDDTMLNMGDPRRAFHYIRTYLSQKNPARVPIIRAFDIPKSLYDEVTGSAISESQRGKLGKDKPYNVDKERAPNQFGLPPSARAQIEAVGTNLVSYVEHQHVQQLQGDPSNGTVKDMDALLSDQLGMPNAEHRKYLAPMSGGHVQSPQQEAAHGANLTRVYDDLDLLIAAMEGRGGNALHIFEFQIRGGFSTLSSNYYGPAIAPLVQAEGYLPGRSVKEVRELRDQIGRAATFSVIPQMVTEEYLQANARLHGQARDKNLSPLSSWAASQQYEVRSLAPTRPAEPRTARGKPSEEEIERAKSAARAKRASTPADEGDVPLPLWF